MIVSASYRTDIPAFYGDWFMKRLAAGECLVANPYGGPPYRVSLDREAVDGFLFWTRNPIPFTGHLEEIHLLGYPFVVHVTITGYPLAIDRSVPPVDAQLDGFIRLASTFGSAAVVWRYDPIVLSSLTPAAFHLDNFERICARLTGSTDEVVISFVNPYRKSRRNLDAVAMRYGFNWWQADESEAVALSREFASIAASNGMCISLCAQPQFLIPEVRAARCVDAGRLARVSGRDITSRRKGNRSGCLCHESRDIGAYDTCLHGCTYCYAVRDRQQSVTRFKQHDPDAPMLS